MIFLEVFVNMAGFFDKAIKLIDNLLSNKQNTVNTKSSAKSTPANTYDGLSEEEWEDLNHIVKFTAPNGKTLRFKFLDLIKFGKEEYVVLRPFDEPNGKGDVTILRVKEVGGADGDTYVTVTDEAIRLFVYEIYKQRNKDNLNFS